MTASLLQLARRFQPQQPGAAREGFVLVLVLIVVAMLSLASYSFSEFMITERRAARMAGRQMQARALADSGVEAIKTTLMLTDTELQDAGGMYDNPAKFRAMLVVDDSSPAGRGAFTIIAPGLEEQGEVAGIRFGLEDESARLNLATLLIADKSVEGGGRQILMQLPYMTEDVADSILDWIDEDEQPREFGAELDTYSAMSPPYAPRNGVPETVEELLLVQGVTPELLFGPDINRNGQIDPNESTSAAPTTSSSSGSSSSSSSTSSDGYFRGWADYMTLYSSEKNTQPDGTARINLNGQDLQALYDQMTPVLGQEWATFIIAYRQNGPYTGTKTGQPGAQVELDFQKQAKTTLKTILDLIGARTQVTPPGQGGAGQPGGQGQSGGQGQNEGTILESPFPALPEAMRLYLPTLSTYCTINPAQTIPGRINVNQASPTILLGIPGMTQEIVDLIVAQREPETDSEKPLRKHETWLLAEEIVTLDQMKALAPFVCGGGSVYRAQIVGYYESEGPAARIEVVVDATKRETPKVLFWRDLSHLGRGFAPATLGVVGM